MSTPKAPAGLSARGRRLWADLNDMAELDATQRILAEEACRMADRLEKLDALLRGDAEEWVRIREPRVDGDPMVIVIDSALAEARQQANVMKQLLAALRLPDEATGKRPAQRGARGAYRSSGAGAGGGTVTALERARRAAGS
jgi:hypothetical protein